MSRVELGDYQTPPALCEAVLATLSAAIDQPPGTLVEPTCGRGHFLVAGHRWFPGAALRGLELQTSHAEVARRALPTARIAVGDVFAGDLAPLLRAAPDPVWVIGNPPWVTSSAQGRVPGHNLPERRNIDALSGLDALTGAGDFDISDAAMVAVVEALEGRDALVAMLLKTTVARRFAVRARARGLGVDPVGLWTIDASTHFGVSVHASLLAVRTGRSGRTLPCFGALDAAEPRQVIDLDHDPEPPLPALPGVWRSGLKHDCARVMVLRRTADGLRNGLGERVDVEPDHALPLLKSTDLFHGRSVPTRAVIVPQRHTGEDTAALARTAPRLWAYLSRHRALLDARRSRIYAGRPPFSVFGVGPYTFAPFKIAISGLHPEPRFTLVEPHGGQPVLVDDTSYFLGFDGGAEARAWLARLRHRSVDDYLRAHILDGAKRPVTAALLRGLGRT